MVKPFLVVLLCLVATSLASGQTDQGPVLYGDAGGRLWKWQDGEKTFLTEEGLNLELVGVDDKFAWGWAIEGPSIRSFTLELPKKKEEGSKKSDKEAPPPTPILEAFRYLRPDRAQRAGERVLLVYGTTTDKPRWELWVSGVKQAARAYDDGRVIFATALGPLEGWMVVGRLADGSPWLELSGQTVDAPTGWRGRLTVATWLAGDEKIPSLPAAAGWAAPPGKTPRPVFWGSEGWSQPAIEDDEPNAGVFPVLGSAGEKGGLTLAGWRADGGTGTIRPWFWDGEAESVPGGAADGQPQVFSLGGKGGAFMIVGHQSAPWFTLEDGHESRPLEGLGPEDHVRTLAPEAAKAAP